MEVKKGYDIEEVVDVIEMLADSQGFYGRLLDEILYIEENEPDAYEVLKQRGISLEEEFEEDDDDYVISYSDGRQQEEEN